MKHLLRRARRAALGAVVSIEGAILLVAAALNASYPRYALFLAGSGLFEVAAGIALLLYATTGRGRRGPVARSLILAASALNLILAGQVVVDLTSGQFGGRVLTDAHVTLALTLILCSALAFEWLVDVWPRP